MGNLTEVTCETLLESLPCYVTLQDRDNNVVWGNRLARAHFGSFQGKKCHEFLGVDQTKCPDCPVQKTLDDREVHTKELILTTNDGARVNVLVYSAPVTDHEGNLSGALEMGVNITSVKEIQKQLILLGETVAGMAHSIKNIMMGLEGGIYVVNKGLEDKNQQEIQEGWDMVLFNFDKISHIVKDLLYCSKPREPNFEIIRPNEILLQVYDLFKETARRYHVEVTLTLDEDLDQAVIDPAGFHTVLTNLLSNAIDACKLDIWKDSHQVEIKSRKGSGGSTIIEVTDNGIGIGKDLKDHVFEDFFSSKGDQGTGLGLMVTQKVIREHGGTITFSSRPGEGTTFVATFPPRELMSVDATYSDCQK